MAMSIRDMADKYGGSDYNSYFSLKDDKDTATVRFMFAGDEEGEPGFLAVPIHEVQIGEYKRKVACTKTPDCPLCRAKMRPVFKLYMQLLDYRDSKDGELKTWERGQSFVSTIFSYIDRFYPMYERTFEIVRNGKKGDPKTTYSIFSNDKDGLFNSIEDLPELEKTVSSEGKVLDLTISEMNQVLNGTFSLQKTDVEPDFKPVSRQTKRDNPF